MKKSNRKTLIKKCDKIWSELVRKKCKCEVCGSKITLQAHHFYSKKGHPTTRHDLSNGILLCYYCHLIRIHQLGDPDVLQKIIDIRGKEWYNELRLRAHSVVKLDYEKILEGLNERLMSEDK